MSSTESAFPTSSLFLAGLSSQLQSKAMKKMDANGDGHVEQTEFQSALEKAAGKLGVELDADEAAQMFAGFDADADGHLSGSEVGSVVSGLLSSLGNLQNFMQSRSDGFDANTFASRDLDGDGVLSLAEFTGAAANTVTTTTITQIVETTVTSPGSGTSGGVTTTTPSTTASGSVIDEGTGAIEQLAATDTTAPNTTGTTSLDSLMASLDTNADGQISGDELTAFVNQITTVVQHYNDTALAKADTEASADGGTSQA